MGVEPALHALERDVTDERAVEVCGGDVGGGGDFGELCERFGISRKQGYKWKERYETGGVQALVDRSRAPHSHPHAVSSDVEQLLLAARKKHSRWGPRKLLVIVRRQHPRIVLPAPARSARSSRSGE